jgi:hypothetical protein
MSVDHVWSADRPVPHLAPLAGILSLPLLGWWLAFWPGLSTPDSFVVWDQARTGGWSQIHSVPYTALAWVSGALTSSPALLTLFQVAVMAVALSMLVRALSEWGLDWRYPFAAALLLVASPILGLFTAMVWKDVLFTASLIILSALLTRWALDPTSRRVMAGMALAAMASVLLRNNGIVVIVVLAVMVSVLADRKHRRGAVGRLVGGAVAGALLSLAAFPLVGVEPAPSWVAAAGFFNDVAVVAAPEVSAAAGGLSEEERSSMELVGDADVIATVARCDTVDAAIAEVDDLGALDAEASVMVAHWTRRLRSDPLHVAAVRGCRAALGWNPVGWPWASSVPQPRVLAPPDWVVVPTEEAVAELEVRGVPLLRSVGYRVANASRAPLVANTVWRGAFWALLATLALWFTRSGRGRSVLLLVAVPWALQIGVGATAPAQDARYVMASVAIGAMVVAGVTGRWLGQRS